MLPPDVLAVRPLNAEFKSIMQKLTAADPETRSADVVGENIERLRELFPEAFTEGRIDFNVLKQLLGGAVDEREEKYGLNWHGKRRARQLALTPSTGTLRPCPEESVDWDTTQNLIIEGDNLEVLKLLQKSYAGKVKLIYIDPPYNTGSDFVYRDDFQDNIRNYLEITGQTAVGGGRVSSNTELSGRFHTDWLNMMYPRLVVARHLLHRTGFFAASIDDHEIAGLRMILDDVFGSENFISQICVVSNPRGRQSQSVATTHEYLLLYAKDAAQATLRGQPLSSDQLDEFKYLTSDGRRYRLRGLRHRGNASRRVDRPNMFYPLFVNPVNRSVSLHETAENCVEVLPRKSTGEDGRWEWGAETANARLDRLEAMFVSGRDEWDIALREFLSDDDGDDRTTKWKSVWDETDINYQNGKSELKELFGEPPFDFPKPTYLLCKLIDGITGDDDIVLDCFAGSGTTCDALFRVNCTDGGHRRAILIQLPEPLVESKFSTIAEITKERVRRSAKRIRDENLNGTGDLGIRTFKLATSNIRAWEPDRAAIAFTLESSIEHLKTDRTDQDILYELLLKLGLDLTVPIESRTIAGKTVHNVGAGTLLVCLATEIARDDVEPLALGIAEWHTEESPAGATTVVFCDSAFADDVAKSNLTAILEQHGLPTVRSL